ncbi:hypothetical protein B0A48_16550 [Cryoendolithus antarcticus]|uniref:Protection of telomeres protein 1 n=1 Tax=Cryoendolithus antarcticus TaxID=1507870 RepID=A0A1V8SEY3_9PEZI|nr:hypothetical protein B0A48_16550 [Cryoendolithus antarcticus]
MALPIGFTDLQTANSAPPGTILNIIGVVVDFLPPTVNRAGQWQTTVRLQDLKFQNSIYGAKGLGVRFFRPRELDMPEVHDTGDIVLIRSVKMNSFNGQVFAISTFNTVDVVFPYPAIPSPEFAITYSGGKKMQCRGTPASINSVSGPEQQYVIGLKTAMSQVIPRPKYDVSLKVGDDRSKLEKGRSTKKLQRICELEDRRFADICGEVIKKFPKQYSDCELYITDYTENKAMFHYCPPEDLDNNDDTRRDGDKYGYSETAKREWPGPFGYRCLKVNIKDPHATFVNQRVKEGDFVLLQNVKIKLRDGYDKLEGDMWPDMMYPTKVQVQFMGKHDTTELKELRERKELYWAQRQAEKERLANAKAPLSKGAKKKRRQQVKLAEEQAARAAAGDPMDTAEDSIVPDADHINPHVRCSNDIQSNTPLASILDAEGTRRHTNETPDGRSYILPFINAKYRTRVRVIEYFPPEIEDFAVAVEGDEDDSLHEYPPSTTQWEWSFSLQLEAAAGGAQSNTSSTWVNVSHQEAQHLLGTSFEHEPCDLRRNPRVLRKLAEKLEILWGDLEERRKAGDTDKPANVPFDCYLLEYGLLKDDGDERRLEDWQRQYMLHGVTIL